MPTLLEQGIAAARAGDRARARQLLKQALQADQRSEQAWLWLSSVVDTDEERARCLQSVLAINPHNQLAQRGLDKLTGAPSPGGENGAPDPLQRRPVRLSPQQVSAAGEGSGPNANTLAMPAALDDMVTLRRIARGAPRGGHSDLTQQLPAGARRPSRRAAGARQPSRPPLLPALIFGTLTVTAAGGLLLMLLIVLLK